jgi:DNA-binding NarL/FixJ family response regulator
VKRIRVVLADDQPLFREGLRTLLTLHSDLEVVGEASNGEEASRVAAQLDADVVLMDLKMPVLDGVAGTRRLRASHPRCRVIALTTFDDDEVVFEALRAGAVGYLLKDVASDKLADAVRAAARGESFLQPSVAHKVLTEFKRLSDGAPKLAGAAGSGLSEREIEVLRLVARGATNKDIARTLDVAEGTVKNHVTSILTKLGVADRTQAALRARDLGIT